MRLGVVVIAGLAAVAAVPATGCGVREDTQPRAITEQVPFDLLLPDSNAPSAAGEERVPGQGASVFLVRDSELDEIERPVADDLRSVLESLVLELTPTELEDGLLSQIPSGTRIRNVEIDAAERLATVDLADELDVENDALVLALAQLVYTATSVDGVDYVRFQVRGEPFDVVQDDGNPADRPLSKADYQKVAPGSSD